MLESFDDIVVEFYYRGEKIDHESKTYNDAFIVMNEVLKKMWDADGHLQDWMEQLEINYCASVVDLLENHIFVYMVNRLAHKRHLGFAIRSSDPIVVVEGGDDRQDCWMIDLC